MKKPKYFPWCKSWVQIYHTIKKIMEVSHINIYHIQIYPLIETCELLQVIEVACSYKLYLICKSKINHWPCLARHYFLKDEYNRITWKMVKGPMFVSLIGLIIDVSSESLKNLADKPYSCGLITFLEEGQVLTTMHYVTSYNLTNSLDRLDFQFLVNASWISLVKFHSSDDCRCSWRNVRNTQQSDWVRWSWK